MRSNKWLILALVLSLGVNIALVGFMAGRASQGLQFRHVDPTVGFMRGFQELDEQRREELRPLLREHFRAVLPSLWQMRGAHRELHQAVLAEPFNAAALETVLADLRRHLGESQEVGHAALVRLATELSAEERRLLIDLTLRPRRGGPPFGPDRPHRRPPLGDAPTAEPERQW